MNYNRGGTSPEMRAFPRIFDRIPGEQAVGIYSTSKGGLMVLASAQWVVLKASSYALSKKANAMKAAAIFVVVAASRND